MKKQKQLGNKGFSLVELIIVIAIMAILVGVLAPQLLRYVERTRVSADTQLADSVRTAVQTAMMDPAVINAATPGLPALPAALDISVAGDFTGEFGNSVATTLGYANVGAMNTGVVAELQSNGATGVTIAIDANSQITVAVTGTTITVQ